jgi:hypothetical protein
MNQSWEKYLDLQMHVEPLQPPKKKQSLLSTSNEVYKLLNATI